MDEGLPHGSGAANLDDIARVTNAEFNFTLVVGLAEDGTL